MQMYSLEGIFLAFENELILLSRLLFTFRNARLGKIKFNHKNPGKRTGNKIQNKGKRTQISVFFFWNKTFLPQRKLFFNVRRFLQNFWACIAFIFPFILSNLRKIITNKLNTHIFIIPKKSRFLKVWTKPECIIYLAELPLKWMISM